jgi:hypothetical protein
VVSENVYSVKEVSCKRLVKSVQGRGFNEESPTRQEFGNDEDKRESALRTGLEVK